jgi:hypothetical protein
MTLQTLSSSFPADPEQAGLAYAQSGLVVEFIIDQYGQDAMAQLLDIFSEGALYDESLTEALGVDTWGLDNAWREAMGFTPLDIAGQAQETSPSAKELVPVPTATSSQAAPAVAATAAPTEEASPPAKRGRLALPCLGSSLTGFAVVGIVIISRRRYS